MAKRQRKTLGESLVTFSIPSSIINGRIVKIGDRVGPNTVIDVRKDKVILNDGPLISNLN